MAAFVVNGTPVTVEKNQKLIRYLRDELHLTSVKDGCSEGACGTCHVLIDGKPTKACIPQTDKLEGKHIVTVEGLSDFEKEAFTYAFGEAGAVQCGFCIPGMVISAKGLIDQNPDPTREEAAFAIRNNICRCTGYVKIIDGILLAAKILREGKIPEKKEDFQVGSRVHRIDVAEKVQGYGKYPDDIYVDGMCYGGAVRSQYPRARVLYIRTKEAEALPGVVCVLTAKDIPGQQNVGHIQKDQPTLIGEGEITQYLGDAVALVCARDQETLEKAKKLVRVVYEELPAVYGPEEASAPGAPEVIMGNRGNLQAHRHVVRGNADEAIKHSKYVLHEKFETPWTEHAFLEPECCVALPLENGGVKLLTTDQSAHTTQHECSAMLGVDFAHCQVENMLVGGGFGGSITLVMVPLILFAVRYGAPWGILAGVAFGTLKYFFAEGFAVSWVSIIFDYSVAYGAVGLAGLFRVKGNDYSKLPLAAFVGCLGRFVIHFISGVTVYAQYMPEEFMGMTMTSPVFYSVLYNGTYMLPNTILAIVICALLMKPAAKLPSAE